MSPVAAQDDSKSEIILSLRGVGKVFHMGEVEVSVLHDVNLDLRHGEISVIVGPSGSGKSTLLNLIGGIDTPSAGSVVFHGADISQYSSRQLTNYRRDKIGFVFQFYNLVPTLNAEENVMVATEISEDPIPPHEALQLVGLTHRVDHFPSQMSGGEQQRVAIARAIAKRPELLLCDEPTGALDLQTGRMILQALVDLNERLGVTIVIITHNEAIAGISHRLVRIGSGTIAEIVPNPQRIPASEVQW